MVSDSMPYVPFSKRTGLEPIPPQLKLGEESGEPRRLLDYYISLEISREFDTYNGRGFTDKWRRVATDLHVMFFKQRIDKFDYNATGNAERLKAIIQRANIGELFDLIEFLVRHPGCSDELKRELADAFVRARAAYRVFDNKYIAAIGTEEQAAAFERAIGDAEAKNATAARKQLIAAGVALRNSDWAGSVRESIHAVEAMAVRLAPDKNTLGAALNMLERGAICTAGLRPRSRSSTPIQAMRKACPRRSYSATRPRWTRPTHCSCRGRMRVVRIVSATLASLRSSAPTGAN